jgi:hypothetical protein
MADNHQQRLPHHQLERSSLLYAGLWAKQAYNYELARCAKFSVSRNLS